ncbi:MAG: polyamine ABC transporter substrate-binding protein [Gammaproteobacteria bacterium]|nr:polyamine ABC transporter substrate-binding protein [Gammaproteobacteria bacterium]
MPVRPALSVLSMALLLAACSKPAEAPKGDAAAPAAAATAAAGDEEKVLNVYNWSDYIESSVIEGFTKETGIKVQYDVFDSNEMLETKLLAGNTGYDIVVPSASFLYRQLKAGVHQKLDKSQLPNLANVDPDIAKRLEAFDPGNEYSVNYMWGTSGVGYNVQKIAERMKDAPVNSFAMFYDPKIAAKFADCGISILDAPSEVLGTVLIYLGKDANSEKPEDLAAAEAVLKAVRPYIKNFHSSAYIEQLANGEICLALGWSGDVLQAKTRAVDAKNGVEVAYNIPKEGAVMFFDQLAIPKDAKHPKNAHLFIDYLLRAEVAAKNSSYISYASANKAATPLVDAAVTSNPNVYPPPELMAKLVPDMPESPEFTRLLTRSWTRVKTGK